MRLAYFQLAAAMAMVGANVAVAKATVPFIPVFIFSFVRFAVSVIAIAPFATGEPGVRFRDLTGRDWAYLVLQSLCGGLIYMVLMLFGLRYTSAMSAGIITSTVPACVALLAVLLLGERLGARKVAALALAVLGILMVNTASPRETVAPWPVLGNTLVAGAVIAEGLFVIFAKRTARINALYRMTLVFNVVGLVVITPFAAAEFADFDYARVPWAVWLLPVFYAITSSILALILWYRGLASVPASEAAIFTSTFPLSTLVVSILFLGEEPQWAHGLGLICVLSAIVLGARAQSNRPAGTSAMKNAAR
jgi:drug/metabolite transporter (DMT)-like permease